MADAAASTCSPSAPVADADIAAALALLRLDDDVTRGVGGQDALDAEIARVQGRPWFAAMEFERLTADDRGYFRLLIDFDPRPALMALTAPSLWLYGDRDDIVPVAESIGILERLRAAGTDITVHTFPGANHPLWVSAAEPTRFAWPTLAPGHPDVFVEWQRAHATAAR